MPCSKYGLWIFPTGFSKFSKIADRSISCSGDLVRPNNCKVAGSNVETWISGFSSLEDQ